MANQYFSLTKLTATASTYFNAKGGGGGFRLGKVENVGIKCMTYYDSLFQNTNTRRSFSKINVIQKLKTLLLLMVKIVSLTMYAPYITPIKCRDDVVFY